MKPKILVVSNYTNTISARPEAEIFLELKKRGMHISVMTDGNSYYAGKFREAGIKVIDFVLTKKFDRNQEKIIRNELKSSEYNILQLFNNKAIANGIRAARGIDVKVIVYRGYAANIYWYDPTAYLKILHPRVDKIICVSEAVRQSLLPHLLFAKHKAITIHKGHKISWYNNIKKANFEEFNIPPNAFVVACVANVRRAKGIRYFLDACRQFEAISDLYVLLIGNKMDRPELIRGVEQSNMKKRIITTGFRKDVHNLMAAADVIVLPSLVEGLSKVLIEAMSLQTAVVATNIPENKTLIEHKKHGILVPVKQSLPIAAAIKLLKEKEDFRNILVANARQRIETDFTLTKTTDKYEHLYNQLVTNEKET